METVKDDLFLDGFNTINSLSTKTSNPTINEMNPDDVIKQLGKGNDDINIKDSFDDTEDIPDNIKDILKDTPSLNSTGAKDFGDSGSSSKSVKKDPKIEELNTDDDIEDKLEIKKSKGSDKDDINDLGEYEEQVAEFFMDKFYEELGWEADDNKPKDVKGIIDTIKKVIEDNSTPDYPDDEVAKIAEFVSNGGKARDFYAATMANKIPIENVDIESEAHQKAILREDLLNKGFKDTQIDKKLRRLEDAGMLQDEAEEALESVKEYRAETEQKLLADQKNQKLTYQKQQQTFFDNVDQTIKEIKTIPQNKKKELLEYVFKPESDGQTKFFKETGMVITHNTNPKRLLDLAYFTKEGDALVKDIERKVESKAAKKLKDTLASSKETRTYNQGSENGRSRDIFQSLGSQLLPQK